MSHSKKDDHKKRFENLHDRVEEYQTPPEEQPAKKKPTGTEERQALVEQRIQEAMERGEFDDLPGKGKPLHLGDNPYLEPGQELAFGLLKNNGFAPQWIERDKEIRKEIDVVRSQLQQAWQQHQDSSANESKWPAAVARFETTLVELNRKIDNHNLNVPALALQRKRLRLADEMQAVQKNSNTK